MKLLNLAVALADLGMRIYRRADDKARREYERVKAWNDLRRAMDARGGRLVEGAWSRIRGER